MRFYSRMPYEISSNHATVFGQNCVLSGSWTENLSYYYGNVWSDPSMYEATLLRMPRWSGFTCQSWNRASHQSQWELQPTEKIYIEFKAKKRDLNRKTKLQKQRLDEILKDLAFSTRSPDKLAKSARSAFRKIDVLKYLHDAYADNYEMRTGHRPW